MTELNGQTPPPLPSPVGALPAYNAAPVPVLPYTMSVDRTRPGIITTIGVVSIVVAALSGIASLMSGGLSFTVYIGAQAARTMVKGTTASSSTTMPTSTVSFTTVTSTATVTTSLSPSPPAPTATAPTPPDDPSPEPLAVGPNGMAENDRKVVMEVLAEMQPLGPQRTRQLDAFLAEQGTSAIPTGGNPLTPQRVRIAVTSSSTLAGTGDDDDAGRTVFVTNWGTLKVYDAKSVFRPADGSISATVVAPVGPAAPELSTTGSVNSPSAAGPLTAVQINQIVQKAQQATGSKLNPAQLAAIRTALQNPNQQLITQATAWSPVRSASVNPDGSAFVWFTGGFLTITAAGQVDTNPYGSAAMNPFINVNMTACGLLGLDAALSIGLAIFLLISAIAVLGQSRNALRLHRIFAWIKIPLVIGGTAALFWLSDGFGTGMSGSSSKFVPWMIALGVLGLIYPIALLIALRTPAVREYLKSA